MDNKILEIFIPGPAGRLEAKYFKSKKSTSPIALVLQPHPQYGGTNHPGRLGIHPRSQHRCREDICAMLGW